MPTPRRLIAPFVVAVLCVSGSACASRESGPPQLVPKLLEKALDDEFRGWRLATFAGDAACQAQAGQSPWAIMGDFNSDGQSDRALVIETAEGLAIVAALRGLDAFRVHKVDTVAAGSAARYLRLEARGHKFPSGVAGVDDHFSHETLAAYTCGGTERVAYVWTGAGFKRVVL
jgi:hypothetical protein